MQYGVSVFSAKPDDPLALVFTPETFGASPDGVQDNTAALQNAINTLEERSEQGIILIPEGTYRFSGTIDLWRGIRLIGYGRKRPRFILDDYAEGFGGPLSKYLFFCRNVRPREGEFLRDANECSFFTSLRNIDIDLGHGNHGAVAVRYHIAQLCSIEDCDFYLNDAKAAIEFVGNEVERCRFFGGTYGIIGYYTAPGWQFYVGDCMFDGQARACIMSSKAGLTLVRDTLRNAPWGVYVPNKELYDVPVNETERLYMEDCRAENITTAVVSMGWLRNPINWLHTCGVVCRNAPMFLEAFGYQFVYFFLEPPITSEYACYRVDSHIGFQVTARNSERRREFAYDYKIEEAAWSPAPDPTYISMPAQSVWHSVRDFGALGDGETDDTAAFEKAIASCDAVYLPQGNYRLTHGLKLRKNTALIALHSGTTVLSLDDFIEPDGADAAMIAVPKDGHNHICGIRFDGGRNPKFTTVFWQGAPDSLMEDCQFRHGSRVDKREVSVNAVKPAEALLAGGMPPKLGHDQLHSLWIRESAGVFKNIWTNDGYAQEGIYISDTNQPGRIYLMSVEHHGEVEIRMTRVSNWMLVSMQTEEAYHHDYTTSLLCDHCSDCVFVNLFEYRMQSFEVSFPYAIRLEQCRNMRFWGVHAFSNGPNGWDHAALLAESGTYVTDREIGTLVVNP